MNGKKERDKRSIGENKRAKVRGAYFKDAFLIIWSHQPNLHFPRTNIRVYKNDYIGKSGDNLWRDDPKSDKLDTDVDRADNIGTGLSNTDRANEPGISILDADGNRRVNNPSIGKRLDRDREMDELGKSGDGVVDNLGISRQANRDGGADNPSIGR